ncbi:unnamed protein product [Adineta steineri]|uniref:F-box domain-containing protein n=1 Tax=Adineta steineri TaxID=433720 RepID=A0A814QMJ2_9BILA|nr:unnamed protein product [Adineta steineri]CAF1459285.1 unnamed protein product [Adineta steineri]
MNISNNNYSNIFDLPNEILFIIIKKLNISDVIYSLVDVNERFGRLLFDPFYIQNLNITLKTMKPFCHRTFSIHEQVLSNICENILPNIHDQVKQLAIEEHSIERIFIYNYSQLYSLSLVNFKEEILCKYLTDYSVLRNLLIYQITHLHIDIQTDKIPKILSKISSNILILILSLCQRLIKLNFCQVFSYRNSFIPICKLPKTCFTYSTLIELKINVATFNDCLRLLDGRFDSLSKLTINVREIKYERKEINNETKLPKLKYFSLTSFDIIQNFDDYIIPLLRRMINLEELILFLTVVRVDSTVIDGIELYDQVLVHMSHLNKKNFNIQNSFIGREYGEVGSYVHLDPSTITGFKQSKGVVMSHVYSLPYQFESFLHLNSSFQDGMFVNVRCLTMTDSYPFEREFFKIISDSFPLVKNLTISNLKPQKNKQHSSTLISFPHLNLLNLVHAHDDYAQQFLVDTNTHLPCLLDLCITYESLEIVTNNFTNDATRLYCSKLKGLHMDKPFVRPKHFDEYFRLLFHLYSFELDHELYDDKCVMIDGCCPTDRETLWTSIGCETCTRRKKNTLEEKITDELIKQEKLLSSTISITPTDPLSHVFQKKAVTNSTNETTTAGSYMLKRLYGNTDLLSSNKTTTTTGQV